MGFFFFLLIHSYTARYEDFLSKGAITQNTHTHTSTRTQIHIHICTNAIAAEGYFVELLSIFVSLSFLSCRVYIYLEKHLYFQSNFLCFFFWLFGFIISPLVACNGCLCTYIVHVHVSVCVYIHTQTRACLRERELHNTSYVLLRRRRLSTLNFIAKVVCMTVCLSDSLVGISKDILFLAHGHCQSIE